MVNGMGSNNSPIVLVGFSKSLTQSLDTGAGSCTIKLPLRVPEEPTEFQKTWSIPA
jgi:hypothetical protein